MFITVFNDYRQIIKARMEGSQVSIHNYISGLVDLGIAIMVFVFVIQRITSKVNDQHLCGPATNSSSFCLDQSIVCVGGCCVRLMQLLLNDALLKIRTLTRANTERFSFKYG